MPGVSTGPGGVAAEGEMLCGLGSFAPCNTALKLNFTTAAASMRASIEPTASYLECCVSVKIKTLSSIRCFLKMWKRMALQALRAENLVQLCGGCGHSGPLYTKCDGVAYLVTRACRLQL